MLQDCTNSTTFQPGPHWWSSAVPVTTETCEFSWVRAGAALAAAIPVVYIARRAISNTVSWFNQCRRHPNDVPELRPGDVHEIRRNPMQGFKGKVDDYERKYADAKGDPIPTPGEPDYVTPGNPNPDD